MVVGIRQLMAFQEVRNRTELTVCELWHNRGPFDTIIRHDRKHPPVDEPELIATSHLELRRYVFGFMLIGTTSRIKTLFIVRLILRPAYVCATLEAESF